MYRGPKGEGVLRAGVVAGVVRADVDDDGKVPIPAVVPAAPEVVLALAEVVP